MSQRRQFAPSPTIKTILIVGERLNASGPEVPRIAEWKMDGLVFTKSQVREGAPRPDVNVDWRDGVRDI